jgi:LPS export ABC transporter protein LptC
MQSVNTKVDSSALNTESADSVIIHYSSKGMMRAILSARKFVHSTTATPPYVDMNNGLRVEFYDGSGTASSVLTAQQGRMFEGSNDVLIRDSVLVSNAAKGEELSTSELVWNDKKQLFFTEKPVTIRTRTHLIYGDGMEANQDFTYYKILNPRGVVAISKANIPIQ